MPRRRGDGEDHQARRREVRNVVEAGARPAKLPVHARFVADHRIEGVDGLVGERAGGTEQRSVKHGGHHPVAGVLRHGLDGGPAHTGLG